MRQRKEFNGYVKPYRLPLKSMFNVCKGTKFFNCTLYATIGGPSRMTSPNNQTTLQWPGFFGEVKLMTIP
jgi:hypothetical protein